VLVRFGEDYGPLRERLFRLWKRIEEE